MAINDFIDAFEILGQLDGETRESRADLRNRTRGLPDLSARISLAETYLTHQRRLWPEMVKSGALPAPSEDVLASMAEGFRTTFEEDVWMPFSELRLKVLYDLLGAAYLRYSDENSNPRSLNQQLINGLEGARKERIFIPWQYIFADAAISGTTSARRGYQLCKRLMESKRENVGVLVIDELGRASRDVIESLNLGRTIDLHGKRMIGVTQNYDSSSQSGKMMLMMFAMVNDYFVAQLREKVLRGRRDAFSQGKTVNKPPIGLKLIPVLDSDGKIVLDDEGRAKTKRVIDEDLKREVEFAKRMYADHSWSWRRIANDFNRRRVGGRDNWTSSVIRKLLERTVYSGVEFDRLTRQVKDPTTGKVTVIDRPESEWLRREVPELKFIADDLEARVQARLTKSKAAYARSRTEESPSRTELHPKSLVRPICSGCRKEMNLGRAGRYASYFCDNGNHGIKGCTFRGYKAAAIIDTLVLGRVLQELASESFLNQVVEEANRCLREAPAREEKIDRAAIEKRKLKAQRKLDALERELDESDEDPAALKVIVKKVAELQRSIDDDRAELARLDKPAAEAARPLSREDVIPLLEDLRSLVTSEDCGEAAPILARLIGNVVVTLEPMVEGGKPEWKAHFKLNGVPILLFLARRKDCPSAATLEFLSTRRWTIGEKVEVWLRKPQKQELIAAEVKALADRGMAIDAIARKLKTSWFLAKAALAFARASGSVPMVLPPEAPKADKRKAKAMELEVVRLRNDEHLSFLKIGKRLGICNTTASRLYDLGKVTENPQPHKRGSYHNLPKEVFDTIESMLGGDHSIAEIAEAAGCSKNTVSRHRKSQSM